MRMENDKAQEADQKKELSKKPEGQPRKLARIGLIAAGSIVAAVVLFVGLHHNFTVWAWLICLYLLVAASTFAPVLWAILFKAELHDGVPSFAQSPFLKDNQEAIERLRQHYQRIFGTLIFWKSAARRNGWFHYYCVGWTIFSSALIPFLTQAINPADAASKWLVTTISAHIAILVGFHRGFKVPERYQAFRLGESEFYDLYRRLLDQPDTFGSNPEEQIRKYFDEVAIIRRFVRKAETDTVPSLEDIREKTSPKSNQDSAIKR